jgi:hypothetical protein
MDLMASRSKQFAGRVLPFLAQSSSLTLEASPHAPAENEASTAHSRRLRQLDRLVRRRPQAAARMATHWRRGEEPHDD